MRIILVRPQSVMYLHQLQTGERLLTFDLDVGSIVGFSGRKEHDEFFYKFVSFLTPGTIYHCNLRNLPIKSTVSV